MSQEEKELLLKDLCARLPYGVRVHTPSKPICTIFSKPTINSTIVIDGAGEEQCCIKDIKPYLFPLSSMTEEQYLKWGDLEHDPLDEILFRDPNIKPSLTTLEHHLLIAKSLYDPINYCYENHFDIYGLIEKGLAIDATGLNIY